MTQQEALDKLDDAMQALWSIKQWADAYPLDIFTEPDWKLAKELVGPVMLSQMSASNMRHVIEGVREIVNPFFPEASN